MTSFSIFRQHCKKIKKNLSKVLYTFENIMGMENFQIHDISKVLIWRIGLVLMEFHVIINRVNLFQI